MSSLKEVFEKWMTDSDFKENFKKNPKQALIDADIQLNEEDLKKVLTTITKQEELEKKINKRSV
jgi:3-deoxy-D-manno-octulosonic acid (KDO) 8-phosphate synthase